MASVAAQDRPVTHIRIVMVGGVIRGARSVCDNSALRLELAHSSIPSGQVALCWLFVASASPWGTKVSERNGTLEAGALRCSSTGCGTVKRSKGDSRLGTDYYVIVVRTAELIGVSLPRIDTQRGARLVSSLWVVGSTQSKRGDAGRSHRGRLGCFA